MLMAKQKTKKSGRLRRRWLLPLGLLALGGICLLYVTFWFQNHFLRGTEVMGVDCSFLSAREAAAELDLALDGKTITLRDGGGEEIAVIPLKDLLEDGTAEDYAALTLKRQRSETWLFAWIAHRPTAYTDGLFDSLDQNRAEEIVTAAAYAVREEEAPQDAWIELGEDGYEIIPEQTGNEITPWRCAYALIDGLHALTSVTEAPEDVIVENGLVRPRVTAESPGLLAQAQAMDAYLQIPISIDFGNGVVYQLTEEDIWRASTVELTDSGAKCNPQRDLVNDLVDRIVDEHGMDGVEAKYHNLAQTREDVHYPVGETGWTMDRETLKKQVFQALVGRNGVKLKPDYNYTQFLRQVYRGYYLPDTFIEISLDNQYMWLYRYGKLIVETPVVTGCIADGDDTRRGVFRIAYKTRDLFLSGPTWYDHVDYWIPFDGEIGLHDSSWRDEYGGDIYLEDGSHGCVNTPLEAMQIVYNNVISGDYVVVY